MRSNSKRVGMGEHDLIVAIQALRQYSKNALLSEEFRVTTKDLIRRFQYHLSTINSRRNHATTKRSELQDNISLHEHRGGSNSNANTPY